MEIKPLSDKEFIEDPMNWPYWPFLPMKRHTEKEPAPEVGIIRALDGEMTTILLEVTVWDGDDLKQNIKDAKRLSYKSTDEMLADGWQID